MKHRTEKRNWLQRFVKEWGIFTIFVLILGLSRLFLWSSVSVDGHSMDPTLADKDLLLVVNHLPIDRNDIVVATETDENGKTKNIVKRVIGMPGDTITFYYDQLYINNKEVDEPYLDEYKKLFAQDKLQSTYSYNKNFQAYAEKSAAFTTDQNGNASFTVKVPEGEYYLMGDDRIVSKDSRQVGTFKRSQIIGETKLRFWPLNHIRTF